VKIPRAADQRPLGPYKGGTGKIDVKRGSALILIVGIAHVLKVAASAQLRKNTRCRAGGAHAAKRNCTAARTCYP
jgi:hypothetical protein